VFGDPQGRGEILLSLLHATPTLKALWSGVSFPLTAGTLWSSLEVDLLHSGTSTTILRLVLLPSLLQCSGLVFQQDNARPHMARVAMNCLQACQTLPWPAR